MNIYLYTICYNERRISPFVVNYWKRFATKVVVYDNGSTDGTLEYLSQFPFIEIRHFDGDGINDLLFLKIKNNWKECRGKCDFVVVCDFDECIYSKNILNEFQNMKDNGCTICAPTCYRLMSEIFPDESSDELAHIQVKTGKLQPYNSKFIVFDPNKIIDMRWDAGCHHAYPTGVVKEYKSDTLYQFHLSDMSIEYILSKNDERKMRLSETNNMRGWGGHYNVSHIDRTIQFENEMKNVVNIENF